MKVFIGIICIQIIAIVFLFLEIKRKSQNTLGVSISAVDSKKIQMVPSKTLKYFWERKPNSNEIVERDWLPRSVKYTINKDGLNERFDYLVEKQKDVFRIITLGDSFTFGSSVNTSENWTELLEDELNNNHSCDKVKKYEVINLAGDGYDMAYETEKYVRRGIKYNPDLVVMLIVDFKRISDLLHQSYLDQKLSPAEKIRLNKKANHEKLYSMYHESVSINDRIKYQKRHLIRLLSVYQNPLILIDHEKNPLFKKTLEDLSNTYGFFLERTKQPLYGIEEYHLADGHPSVEGHVEIMKEVEGFLLKDSLIPCKNK